jgi:hypothetical protein
MRTRWLTCWLAAVLAVLLHASSVNAEEAFQLPRDAEPAPVDVPHFPDRLHALVWRNWRLIPAERIARAVGATSPQIEALAASMGLPADVTVSPHWRRRGYITIVRRNWHLVPYEQLLILLDMTAEELALALREDDFLFVKLGSHKPRCEPIVYREPNDDAKRRAAMIAECVATRFSVLPPEPSEQPFDFIAQLSSVPEGAVLTSADAETGAREQASPRFIYSYFGVFGDPLADAALDPYPDGLLARLAERGVNGVWLHVVLRQLAPGGPSFPEFGAGHEQRLENLRRLVDRARQFGIAVYLYINEPRAMPTNSFADREQLGGVIEGDFRTLCTSADEVRTWLVDALAYVFREVPHLGGVFTISASENLTNCASHGGHAACPHCREFSSDQVIADVNSLIAAGVRRGNPDAKVFVWDWGWNNHGVAAGIIERLPANVWLQSVSEWAQPIERGGVSTTVGEYSLSVVGPGPRAKQQWALARARGLKTLAKLQLNTTWELAAVPYLPVMDLVAEHCARLRDEHVDGAMLSWSVGGYPSPNLVIAKRFFESPTATPATVLDELAADVYGPAGAAHARRAWTAFSQAFAEYPYHGALVYQGPQQLGPANLLFAAPTGYTATMVGFPYDDLAAWHGPYPDEAFLAQLRKVAAGWADGVEHLQRAVASVPPHLRGAAEADLRVAQAAGMHFASVANQVQFVVMRTALLASDTAPEQRAAARTAMLALLDDEIDLAKQLFALVGRDSRIGFEASNHYFYVAGDLVEKVISCEDLRRRLVAEVND